MTGPRNTIFIGSKLSMNYVLAIVTELNGGSGEILLKARGKSISRALDVTEIVRTRFVEDLSVKDIRIGTERVLDETGQPANVSTIEIKLARAAAGGASEGQERPDVTTMLGL